MNEWRIAAKRLLREGYGVEDIALATGASQQDVRQFLTALRASGRLREVLFGRKTKARPTE